MLIDANAEIQGKFLDEFSIVTKHEIYKIPIYADIKSAPEFELLDKESREINKRPLLKPHVQEVPLVISHPPHS